MSESFESRINKAEGWLADESVDDEKEKCGS
jgi:hypothetical protein